jgi:hypothetical protein
MPLADRRKSWLGLAGFAVGGLAFGRLMASMPAPETLSIFWLGNLCAPWLALSFFAGRVYGPWQWAVLAGALTEVTCVVGFYSGFLVFWDAARIGMSPSTPLTTVAEVSIVQWLHFTSPWLLAATVSGALYGTLGHLWRRTRLLVAGLAVAFPFLAEPALWPAATGHYQGPWYLWTAEIAVGLAVAARAYTAWRAQARTR